MSNAAPALLEPIMLVTLSIPEDSVGDVIGDLNSRRGRPQGMEGVGGGLTEVKAEVPMAEMLTYAPDLRSLTGGQGDYTMEFVRYEEVPAHLRRRSSSRRPIRRRSTRNGSVALVTTGATFLPRRRYRCMTTRVRIAAAALVAALSLTACGGGDDPPPPATSTATTPPPSALDGALWPDPAVATPETSPREVGRSFIVDFLRMENPPLGAFQQGDSRSGEVQVFQRGEGGTVREDRVISTIALRQLDGRRWFVIAAFGDEVQIGAPDALATISSPVTVAGQARGYEGNIGVRVYAAFDPKPLVEQGVAAGNMEIEPFSDELALRASADGDGRDRRDRRRFRWPGRRHASVLGDPGALRPANLAADVAARSARVPPRARGQQRPRLVQGQPRALRRLPRRAGASARREPRAPRRAAPLPARTTTRASATGRRSRSSSAWRSATPARAAGTSSSRSTACSSAPGCTTRRPTSSSASARRSTTGAAPQGFERALQAALATRASRSSSPSSSARRAATRRDHPRIEHLRRKHLTVFRRHALEPWLHEPACTELVAQSSRRRARSSRGSPSTSGRRSSSSRRR